MTKQSSAVSDGVRVFLDGVPYPTFGISNPPGIAWANAAARDYFGMGEAEMTPRFAEGAWNDSRRALHEVHLPKWLSGERPYPVPYSWDGATGRGEFLLVPFPTPAVTGAAVAVVLIPSAMATAAMRGRAAEASAHAGTWADQLAAEVTALRERPGGERPASGDAALASLTRRQWEIASRLAEGDRVSTLTEDLGISANTVRNHLKAVFRKLGVSSQAQLVRRLKRGPLTALETRAL